MHHSVIAVAIACSFASTGSWSGHSPDWIVGLEKAKYYKGSASGEYFIQAGAFSVKNNAVQYQRFLQSKTKEPVHIRTRGNLNIVLIGPLHSAHQVRNTAQNLSSGNQLINKTVHKPLVIKEKIVTNVDKDGFLIPPSGASGFFVGIQGGASWSKNHTMFVNNGLEVDPPFNRDAYTVEDNNSQGFVGTTVGYRRYNENKWMPAWSLGVRYNHLFSQDIGRDVLITSDPDFREYAYNLNLSSDTVMAMGKLNVVRFNHVLPYVSGGLGAAYNRLSNYSERALPQVTIPRVSPAFAGNTNTEFTYSLGAGIDYQFNPLVTLSVGYEYQNFGRFNTGSGVDLWSGVNLEQNSFHTNSLLLSMDYLFAD